MSHPYYNISMIVLWHIHINTIFRAVGAICCLASSGVRSPTASTGSSGTLLSPSRHATPHGSSDFDRPYAGLRRASAAAQMHRANLLRSYVRKHTKCTVVVCYTTTRYLAVSPSMCYHRCWHQHIQHLPFSGYTLRGPNSNEIHILRIGTHEVLPT